jgi:hypothetical protein
MESPPGLGAGTHAGVGLDQWSLSLLLFGKADALT